MACCEGCHTFRRLSFSGCLFMRLAHGTHDTLYIHSAWRRNISAIALRSTHCGGHPQRIPDPSVGTGGLPHLPSMKMLLALVTPHRSLLNPEGVVGTSAFSLNGSHLSL